MSDLELGDARFDVIAAFDLFTHMWPDDVLAYLGISRARSPSTVGLPRPSSSSTRAPAIPLRGGPCAADAVRARARCRYESEDDPLDRVGYELRWLVLGRSRSACAGRSPPLRHMVATTGGPAAPAGLPGPVRLQSARGRASAPVAASRSWRALRAYVCSARTRAGAARRAPGTSPGRRSRAPRAPEGWLRRSRSGIRPRTGRRRLRSRL